jgi:hypothetical protein
MLQIGHKCALKKRKMCQYLYNKIPTWIINIINVTGCMVSENEHFHAFWQEHLAGIAGTQTTSEGLVFSCDCILVYRHLNE